MLRFLWIVALAACATGGMGQPNPDAAPSGGQCGVCQSPDECCQVGGSFFCLDTGASDPMNCGGCGAVCNPSVADKCAGRTCECGSNPACTGGTTCCNGQCVSGTCNGGRPDAGTTSFPDAGTTVFPDATVGGVCTGSQVDCSGGTGTCTDVCFDSANCGDCGQACDPSGICFLGFCTNGPAFTSVKCDPNNP